MNEEEKLHLSVDQEKLEELLTKLSRASELVEELNDLLDSIKQTEGLFKTKSNTGNFDLVAPVAMAGDDEEKLNQLLSVEFQKLTAQELAERLVNIEFDKTSKVYLIRLKA